MQKILYIFLSIITIGIFNFYLKKYNGIDDKNNHYTNELDRLTHKIENQFINQNMVYQQNIDSLTQNLDVKLSSQNIKSNQDLRFLINELENKVASSQKLNNEQIKEVISKMAYINSSQEQLIKLGDSVEKLEKTLSDKKSRGYFGEIQLNNIFESIFGKDNSAIFEKQYILSNNKQVDMILHTPKPLGSICIDSKFPLENYLEMINVDNNSETKLSAQRKFKSDIKKHINDIAEKYIINNETATQAIMFIPSEAIFSEINLNNQDLILYSYKKNILIASPTTLIGILNVIQIIIKDIHMAENVIEIQEQLSQLKDEFIRYDKRWNNFQKHLDNLYTDAKDITVTSKKITNKFIQIEAGEKRGKDEED